MTELTEDPGEDRAGPFGDQAGDRLGEAGTPVTSTDKIGAR